jgi:hypothetical protein
LLTPKPSEASADTPQATSTSPAQPSSQQSALLAVAAFAAVGPLVLTKFDPTAFGQLMTVPVGLAWSLFGFLAGRAVGVNPMVVGAVAATAGVFWHGKLMGWGYNVAIDAFFGQVGWVLWQRLQQHLQQLLNKGCCTCARRFCSSLLLLTASCRLKSNAACT